jgi:hypothetical protein
VGGMKRLKRNLFPKGLTCCDCGAFLVHPGESFVDALQRLSGGDEAILRACLHEVIRLKSFKIGGTE